MPSIVLDLRLITPRRLLGSAEGAWEMGGVLPVVKEVNWRIVGARGQAISTPWNETGAVRLQNVDSIRTERIALAKLPPSVRMLTSSVGTVQ